MSLDKFNKLVFDAWENTIKDNMKNSDSSYLTQEMAKDMISRIDGCQWVLSGLLKQTEDIGGFCNYYVKDALKQLDIMRTILELQIKGNK